MGQMLVRQIEPDCLRSQEGVRDAGAGDSDCTRSNASLEPAAGSQDASLPPLPPS